MCTVDQLCVGVTCWCFFLFFLPSVVPSLFLFLLYKEFRMEGGYITQQRGPTEDLRLRIQQ